MTVVLEARADIDLHAVRRVAWQGENVQVSRQALERIAECRRSFLALLDADPELVVYGVTTGYGEQANVRLSGEERRAQAARPPRWPDASFGKPLPRRITRAIVLARLANFIEGHAAVRPELAQAVAGMLAEDELPELSVQGHGDAGEIVALSRLFADLGERDVAPRAVDLVDRRHAIGEAICGEADQVGDGLGTRRLRCSPSLHRSPPPGEEAILGVSREGRDRVSSEDYAVTLAACGDLVASPRLATKRVLSILPWKIGTPISMHFSITSRRSRPASRASSVGVR